MWWALAIIGMSLVGVWAYKGMFRDRWADRDKADEEYHKAMQANRDAERELDDPEYRDRLFDEDNDSQA